MDNKKLEAPATGTVEAELPPDDILEELEVEQADLLSAHSRSEKNQIYAKVAERFLASRKRGNRYYHELLAKNFAYNVPKGHSVLELGSSWGELLRVVQPSRGVGIDSSAKMVEVARLVNPEFEYIHADAADYPHKEKFDSIIISDLLGSVDDIWQVFRNLRGACKPETRIVISQYNYLWMPTLKLAEKLGLKQPGIYDHWLNASDIETFLNLNGFELVSKTKEVLLPIRIPFISNFLNSYIAHLPIIRSFGLVQTLIAKPRTEPDTPEQTVSIIIPTRNERGNIRGAVERIPDFGKEVELIFVDGSSTDGTIEEIEKYIEKYKETKDISLIHQVSAKDADHSGKMLKLGKGDAVRKGFAAAKNDILMILDSDLTVPPEDLDKFYLALKEGHCDFANGSRLVYQMEPGAMRFLNIIANYMFGRIFSYLLEQRTKDTLCGTKCLSKPAYRQIEENRKYFGDFDPFGDFDLLFGAAKLHLKISDVPIRYRSRVYGEIKIERFKHGLILFRMCLYSFFKMKVKK